MRYMGKTGFDSEKYARIESKAIAERASHFHKLYLEAGGKLLYDYHAMRVLPGYEPDAKMRILKQLNESGKDVEFLLCVSAKDIESGRKMGALGVTYRDFTLKMIDSIEDYGFEVNTIVITMYAGQQSAKDFGRFLEKEGYSVYYRGLISGYPNAISKIASKDGFGKGPIIKTKRKIVVVAGAGPGSGKMATGLTMVYQDYLAGKDSGYAKIETFPVWNLPLASPINYAYEAATADIGDYNLIDPYHLKAHGVRAVNYNRDVEGYVIIQKLLKRIISEKNYMRNYNSPTDMGINMIKDAITDMPLCERAARQEIIRRHFAYSADQAIGIERESAIKKVKQLMEKLKIKMSERPIVDAARKESAHARRARKLSSQKAGIAQKTGVFAGAAVMLPCGQIVSAQNTPLMHAESGAIINALKTITGIRRHQHIISPYAIRHIQMLKHIYGDEHENLNVPEALISLAISAHMDKGARRALDCLQHLKSCEMHTTHLLSREDESVLRKLGINVTSDGKREYGRLTTI